MLCILFSLCLQFNNINETEFTTKYNEYIRRVEKRRQEEEQLLLASGEEPEIINAGYFDAEFEKHRCEYIQFKFFASMKFV